MDSAVREFDEEALTLLDEYLMSDRAPENRLDLSDLDGLLTAVAVGPELIMPSEWLPVVWGGDEPEFEDMEEANTVLGAIMARYNQILRQVQQGEFAPLFWTGPEGQVLAADWCEGFMDGIRLRLELWEPLFRDDDGQGMLFPILALCSDERGDDLLELEPEEREEVLAEAPDLIPGCVEAIHQFWKDHSQPKLNTVKFGRNEPCPCGSGKKYKRCCGAN